MWMWMESIVLVTHACQWNPIMWTILLYWPSQYRQLNPSTLPLSWCYKVLILSSLYLSPLSVPIITLIGDKGVQRRGDGASWHRIGTKRWICKHLPRVWKCYINKVVMPWAKICTFSISICVNFWLCLHHCIVFIFLFSRPLDTGCWKLSYSWAVRQRYVFLNGFNRILYKYVKIFWYE